MTFKLTYSTMFDPPEAMHEGFEAALAEVRAGLGATHAMYVDGRDVHTSHVRAIHTPIDERVLIGRFPSGEAADVDRAVTAAGRAFESWRRTPMPGPRSRTNEDAGLVSCSFSRFF